mgnify:CR=1
MELKQCYNNKFWKKELLKWRDKRYNYPDNITQQLANLRKVVIKFVFEEMFEFNSRRNSPMEKARREIMML